MPILIPREADVAASRLLVKAYHENPCPVIYENR